MHIFNMYIEYKINWWNEHEYKPCWTVPVSIKIEDSTLSQKTKYFKNHLNTNAMAPDI